jgi:hypothetical protein
MYVSKTLPPKPKNPIIFSLFLRVLRKKRKKGKFLDVVGAFSQKNRVHFFAVFVDVGVP